MGRKWISIKVVAILMVLLSCMPSMAASNVEITGRLGIDGDYKIGVSVPVTMTITTKDMDFSGKIKIDIPCTGTTYQQKISMSKGKKQIVRVPIQLPENGSQGESIQMSLVADNGKTVASNEINIPGSGYSKDDIVIGLMSDDDYSKLIKLINVEQDGMLSLSYKKLKDDSISGSVANLEMFNAIVLSNYDTTKLLPEQVDTLKAWVNKGGTLIVGTGNNGVQTLSGLTKDFLQVNVEDYDQEILYFAGQGIIMDTLRLSYDEEALKEKGIEKEEKPLYTSLKLGAGKVLLMKYDLQKYEDKNTEAVAKEWQMLLNKELQSDTGIEFDSNCLEEFLQSVRRERLPKPVWINLLLIVYILVLSLGTYFVLKKKKKKEYVWLIAPALSLFMTLLMYGMSRGSRLVAFPVNQLDVEYINGEGDVRGNKYQYILNTTGSQLEMTMSADEVLNYRSDDDEDLYYFETPISKKYIDYEGNQIIYRRERGGIYEGVTIQTIYGGKEHTGYKDSVVMDKTNYKIKFTNNGEPIDMLFVIEGMKIWEVGPVKTGESINKSLSSTSNSLYQLNSEYQQHEDTRYLSDLLELMDGYDSFNVFKVPTYVAVIKKPEESFDTIKGDNKTEFNYKLIIKEMGRTIDSNGDSVSSSSLIMPTIKEQTGNGYIDQGKLQGTLKVVLDYDLGENYVLDWARVKMRDYTLWEQCGNPLNGSISIFNNETNAFELIDDSGSIDEILLQGEDFHKYVKDNHICLEINGKDESDVELPYIVTGGKADVRD